MENTLWADIQIQAENLPRVIQHLYSSERAQLEAAAECLRPDRPTVLIGMASAEYLCAPAALFLGQRGRFASTLGASDAIYAYLPALRSANVVINSRSGETAEVVKLGQALADEAIPFVLITNEPESTIAGMADRVVWANTHKDDLVSINVVSGMMTATLMLAAAATGELDALRPDFEALGQAMGGVVAQASAKAEEIHQLFAGIRPVYLLYRGADRGAAYCGRLVLEEVARTPAVAMEAAEFRQGPNEVIDERFGAVLFSGSGKQAALNRALAENICQSGGRVLLVGPQAEQGSTPAWGGERFLALPVPDLPAALLPVLEVVPVQVLAYRLAQAQGYPPGQVRYISKVILSEAGIPNQS